MRLPDRIWVPGLAGLLLSLVFVGALLVRTDGDPSVLVHAGPPWTSAEEARGSLTVQEADEAFDGQFFYRIGVAPWSTDETVEGVTFDLPSLRNARWGFGALAWVASAGDPDLVPWALIGLNVIAAAAVGAVGGGLARTANRHAAWGAVFVLWPGFAYSLSLDTSELVAAAFLLGALLAVRHRRWWSTGLLLTAALLVRDTTAVVAFGVAAAGVATWWSSRRDRVGARRHEDPRPEVAAGLVPLAVFAGWQLLQRARFGSLPLTSSGDNNLSAPFAGFLEQFIEVLPPSGAAEALRLVSMVGLVALVVGAGWSVVRRREPTLDAEKLSWVAAVVVVIVLNAYLWSGATAFLRAATEAGLLSILLLVRWATPRLLAASAGLAALWLLTAVAQVGKLG